MRNVRIPVLGSLLTRLPGDAVYAVTVVTRVDRRDPTARRTAR
jgi:hypothetical protein